MIHTFSWTNTDLETPETAEVAAVTLLERLRTPMLLFAAALFVSLLFSWFFLLPRFTKVEMGGSALDVASLLEKRNELEADIASLREKRESLLFPHRDPDYVRLRDERDASEHGADVYRKIRDTASSVAASDAIVFSSITIDVAAGAVELRGDVRNVGPRSMTVLAQFLDALDELSFVEGEIPRPSFVRDQSPVIGPHSPFTIRFSLVSQ